jgi:hypothetical protein
VEHLKGVSLEYAAALLANNKLVDLVLETYSSIKLLIPSVSIFRVSRVIPHFFIAVLGWKGLPSKHE